MLEAARATRRSRWMVASPDTIGDCWRAGADMFVAENAIFSAHDPVQEIAELRGRCGVSV